MTKLSDHQSAKFVKLCYIGDSGTGKTGSLTSLVAAGFKLRILDLDNGLDVLKQFIQEQCPDKIGNVDFETVRDPITSTPTGPVVKNPKALVRATELMNKWTDGTSPQEWGADTIFVLDSLSQLGRNAFFWARGQNPGAKEPRTWFYVAQQAIENLVDMLTSEAFHCNLIIISHIRYTETEEGTRKGYPNSIGQAQSAVIPRYFNTLLLAETSGSGKHVRRKIRTIPTAVVDLKNPAPFKVEAELPLETGLATIFNQLRDGT